MNKYLHKAIQPLPENFRPVLYFIIAFSILLSGCTFIDVVKNGSPGEISAAVKNGADVNRVSSSGETPLICAIRYNSKAYDAAVILVNAGSSVNRPDSSGFTPLHCAVILPSPDEAFRIADLLIKHGADLNAKGGFDSSTPLMNATSRRDGLKITELLIKNGADIKITDVRNESAIHYAASVNGTGEIISLLIRLGADVNSGTPADTPLHKASCRGAEDNIRILLKHNASINVRDKNSEAKTPLEMSVDTQHFECAKILIENGADINTETYYNFQPFKYRNSSQTYLNKLAHVDVSTIQFEKMTPLHRAVTHNSLPFVEYLLIKGAKTNKEAHFGGYPLDFAFYLNYLDIAGLLIKHKSPSLFADLLLHDAVEERNLNKTGLLLEAGANVKYNNYTGDTPLHIASKNGDIEIVKLLLKYKADVSAVNHEGRTPRDIAAGEEIRKLLKP